jgi:plastocyanin
MSNRTFTALVISMSMLSATITLSTMTNDSFAQGSDTTSSSSEVGQGTAAAGMSLNCQSIASIIGGIVVPNPNKICDVLIPRKAPTTDHSVLKSQDFDKYNTNTNSLARVSVSALIPHEIKISIVPNAAYVGNKAFSPNPVNIKAEDTITWIDNDVETHTVTSGSGSNDASAGKLLDSGVLDYGQGFSHTFNIRGEFSYFCQFHPSMTGNVIVT